MQKKLLLILLFALLLPVSNFAQPTDEPVPLDWPVLAQVRYKSYQTPGMMGGEKPEPGMVIKRLQYKKVSIRGYVIPLDIDGNTYMLSALPNASCFFCGKAGMESVVELNLTPGHRKFKMDEVLTFTGNLLLNDDEYGLLYILEDAEEF